jgi:hypothetical protein
MLKWNKLLSILMIFVSTSVYADTKTFQLNKPDFPPEGKKNFVQDLTAGFAKKTGGDLFVARIGASKFKYEYEGEWITFEPQGHGLALATGLFNEFIYSNYWTDTDLRFTVRDYGVKVDIVLKTDKAPAEFSFRISKSAGWQDEWIRPAYAYITNPYCPVGMEESEVAGLLAYTITQKGLTADMYPVVIDPTFDLAHSVDDTVGLTGFLNANLFTDTNNAFGRLQPGAIDTKDFAYIRWILDIPRASKVTTANQSWRASLTESGSFTSQIYLLDQSGSPAWKTTGATGGFHTDQYADGTALLTIANDAVSSVAWTPVAWTPNTWYDSPEIKALVQAALDSFDYAPLSATDKYVGFHVDDGDGPYNPPTRRVGYSYDFDPAFAPELDITYDPWGEIRTPNGYKYNGTTFSYYDY